MLPCIIGGAVLVIAVLWFILTQRSLTMLVENMNYVMGQIDIQLSARWDALSVLLDLIGYYAAHEYPVLAETIKARRPITAESAVVDAAVQENLLIQAMGYIITLAEQYPALKADQRYQKTVDSINQYGGMVCQSRLIYNDCVTQFNRRICTFPVSMITGMMGFSKRGYLEAQEQKTDMFELE